ncbi:MAG TPA: hypothetical protein VHM70_18750 [Polyangiaceae bacterium]|nr:hypothetical protein [Polyangiaceae bacterium]
MGDNSKPSSAALIVASALLALLSSCSEPTNSTKGEPSAVPNMTLEPTVGDTTPQSPNDAETSPSGETSVGVSGSDAGAPRDSAFEPAWLPNVPLDDVAGELTLFASTLSQGPNGLELYAAVRNDGAAPLCGAAMSLEFYDHADQLLGTASGGIRSALYQFSDGSSLISIYCVAPGQTAMAAATTLPEGLTLDQLKYIGHRFPAFQIDDAKPVPGATLSQVEEVAKAEGTAYRGTVTNSADTPISDPKVAVFPVNGVGRPLGMATSAAMLEIPPAGTWSFETSTVSERGVDRAAFVTATAASSE